MMKSILRFVEIMADHRYVVIAVKLRRSSNSNDSSDMIDKDTHQLRADH